jgi:hypothetical protein
MYASVASASGKSGIAIDYAGGDQTVDPALGIVRGLHVNTNGTLVLVLSHDPVDAAGLPYVLIAGQEYALSVRKIVKAGSSGVTGNILF